MSTVTYEQVLDLINRMALEADKRAQEFDKRMQESAQKAALEADKRAQEFDKRMQESAQKAKAEMTELRKSHKLLQKEIGALGGRLGDFVVEMVRGNVIALFNELGYPVGSNTQNYEYWNDDKKQILAEADLILLNGEIAVIVEAKLKVETKDITHFLKQMDIIKTRPDRITAGLQLIGAIAGGVISGSDVNFAQKNGLYVIRQNDDTFEIVPPPEGFQAKVW
ncbi:hypothetical protein FACS189427_07410 [Planctomycetales bacterium]|nr:hypothetical protein FACS189427_07410 [Planctomycetales bacterium]